MNIAEILRYWHTARYLKPVQLYGRVQFALARPRPTVAGRCALRAVNGAWVPPADAPQRMFSPSSFRFLNVEGTCESAADWNDEQRGRLWLYNLHYFEDLGAAGAGDRTSWHRTLIERWIAENPPARGAGWEPYPTSLRLVNWAKWILAGNEPSDGMLMSMALQASWLSRRIEHHLQGNHLLANAKALVVAGLVLETPPALEWLAAGVSLMRRELDAQLLDDGGHDERSPMYHALILEDTLDLINFTSAFQGLVPAPEVERLRADARRMLSWLLAMTHPDGEIAFFNDAAFGIARAPAQLSRYAERLGLSIPAPASLSDSGYVRVLRGDALLLADVAPVGPDHQPGHAHADTLSFELSLGSQRVLVNGGTSTYSPSDQRRRERGTAAHNTVEINGLDSSEVWAAFRVARRARPTERSRAELPHETAVAGAHDGYRRLAGSPVHRREWRLRDGELEIADRITGKFATAVARFHLHPDVRASVDGSMVIPGMTPARWRVAGAESSIVTSAWHPGFGVSVANQCIEARLTGPECVFTLEWVAR